MKTAYALAGSEQSGMSALEVLRANGEGELIPTRTTLNKQYAEYKSKEGSSGYMLKSQVQGMLKWVRERNEKRGEGGATKILRLAIDATDITPRLYINPQTLLFSGDVKCGAIGGEDPAELQAIYIKLMRALEAIWNGTEKSLEAQARAILAVRTYVKELEALFVHAVDAAETRKQELGEGYCRKNMIAAGLKPPPKNRRGRRTAGAAAAAAGEGGATTTGKKRKRSGPEPRERAKEERAALLVGRLVEDDMEQAADAEGGEAVWRGIVKSVYTAAKRGKSGEAPVAGEEEEEDPDADPDDVWLLIAGALEESALHAISHLLPPSATFFTAPFPSQARMEVSSTMSSAA